MAKSGQMKRGYVMIRIYDFHTEAGTQHTGTPYTHKFDCICRYHDSSRFFMKCIPWHWHTSFELDYIVEGEMTLLAGEECRKLQQGDLAFLNSNVMHKVEAGQERCRFYTIYFTPYFLSGNYDSIFEQKYLLPVVQRVGSGLDCRVYHAGNQNYDALSERFRNMVELFRYEPEGYEILVRNELSLLWLTLWKDIRRQKDPVGAGQRMINDRVKSMLEYISRNYQKKILVEDIAMAANVSTRECSRSFRKCLGATPLETLNRYRIRRAVQMLYDNDRTIEEISEACGFSSTGYFIKVFHELTGETPADFRNKSAK